MSNYIGPDGTGAGSSTEPPFHVAAQESDPVQAELTALRAEVRELEADNRELERVIDNMVADGRAALERLGLSRVSDGGSLKNDEAWGAVRIMEDRIRELEAAKGGSQ